MSGAFKVLSWGFSCSQHVYTQKYTGVSSQWDAFPLLFLSGEQNMSTPHIMRDHLDLVAILGRIQV